MSYDLKEARINSGKTLQQASFDLKIRKHYLAALEEENFDVLPGEVYMKGYLKLYKNYLNIQDFIDFESTNNQESKREIKIDRRNKVVINYKYKKQLTIISILMLSIIFIIYPLILKT